MTCWRYKRLSVARRVAEMSRPQSRTLASAVTCVTLVAVLGRVDGGDEGRLQWARGGRHFEEVVQIPEGSIVDGKWL